MPDVGALDQRNSQHRLAKLVARFHVHLVVGQPHRHLGDLGRELLDLDAVKLVHVDPQEVEHMAHPLAELAGRAQHVQLDPAQLAVGHHQEVAAAAGRVQKVQRLQPLVELEQLVLVASDGGQLGAQLVEKQRADQAQDVGLAGVVRAQFSAPGCGVELHHLLEHRAEDRRRDLAPLDTRQRDQLASHLGVEGRRVHALLEQAAVDVLECGVVLGQRPLPFVRRPIECGEQGVEHGADVRAVNAGVELDQVGKQVFGLEDAGVVGEQAEQQADEKHLQRVAVVTVTLQGVVQLTHGVGGAAVDRVFVAYSLFAVAGDEVEQVDLAWQVFQREAVHAVLFEVMQLEVPEVTDQDVARQFVVAQARKVVDRLPVGARQILAPTLLLHQQRALPEQVDIAIALVEFFDALLEARHLAALHAKDLEKGVEKTLGLGVFVLCVLPLAGKVLGAVTNLVPAQRHGFSLGGRISTCGAAWARQIDRRSLR